MGAFSFVSFVPFVVICTSKATRIRVGEQPVNGRGDLGLGGAGRGLVVPELEGEHQIRRIEFLVAVPVPFSEGRVTC
jgi:hypothetical protein